MTEQEWRDCDDPEKLLAFLRDSGKAMDRKLRLFACACCRRVHFMIGWALAERQGDYRRAIEASEKFADGEASQQDLERAFYGADDSTFVNSDLDYADLDYSVDPFRDVASEASSDVAQTWWKVLLLVREFGLDEHPTGSRRRHDEEEQAERAAHAGLLRDIFGSPLRPLPPLEPSLLTRNDALVLKLAQAAYAERLLPSGNLDPARLSILADALEDAGCQDEELLSHLRDGQTHVRGCWAVDCLLSRE